jgi:hypothetical protein
MNSTIAGDRRDLICDGIRESRQPSRTFCMMNALVTIIAC